MWAGLSAYQPSQEQTTTKAKGRSPAQYTHHQETRVVLQNVRDAEYPMGMLSWASQVIRVEDAPQGGRRVTRVARPTGRRCAQNRLWHTSPALTGSLRADPRPTQRQSFCVLWDLARQPDWAVMSGSYRSCSIWLLGEPSPRWLLLIIISLLLLSARSQSAGSLSVARGDLAAASAGTKVVFAGGRCASLSSCSPSQAYRSSGPGIMSPTVDIYDSNTGLWNSTATGAGSLSVARYWLAAASAGTKVVFAGGRCAPLLSCSPSHVISQQRLLLFGYSRYL